jgi:hypothetical protein
MLKIAIGIPTGGTIHARTAFSLIETVRLNNYNFLPIFSYGNFAAENKEKIVRIAQDNLCSHLFLADCDMGFPTNAIEKLLAHNKDIVGTMYNYRFLPPTTVTKFFSEEPQEDVFKVAGAGTGLMLIRMTVFDKLKPPYFPMEFEEGKMILTEDIGFCEKARENGFDVWIDKTIKVLHYGEYGF